jgi:uncharacterized membrane protein
MLDVAVILLALFGTSMLLNSPGHHHLLLISCKHTLLCLLLPALIPKGLIALHVGYNNIFITVFVFFLHFHCAEQPSAISVTASLVGEYLGEFCIYLDSAL